MNNFLFWYQHLPLNLGPTAFRVGSFSIGWYALMYLVGFAIVFLLLVYRIKKQESHSIFSRFPFPASRNLVLDFLFYALLGVLVGGRLGYALFYNLSYYIANPLEIVSPFSSSGQFVGIYGMSYHGGAIGVFVATIFFLKKYKLNFWSWADFVVPAIPAGYFFGRIGNFLNGELYGRTTESFLGMYFPDDPFHLRHPSQLYEAFLEGVIVFLVLWFFRNKKKWQGKFLGIYFVSYSIARFVAEFFREPDAHLGYAFDFFTRGQIFSLIMLIVGIKLLFKKIKIGYNIESEKT